MANANTITIGQFAELKGFVKNGLDSSTLVDLIIRFDSAKDFFEKRGFSFPNIFYYHRISRKEVIGILINKFKYPKKDAASKLDNLTHDFNMRVIERNPETDSNFESIVEAANAKAAQQNQKLKIGEQDIIILGGFLRENVSIVHSADVGMLATCKELGINSINITRS